MEITYVVHFWQVKTTPHVSGSVNPVWEAVVEFLVKDFTKVRDKHFSERGISPRDSFDRFSKKICTCNCVALKHKMFVFQTSVSFLVYDRDVNWQGQSDDFMGSCNLQMTLVRNRLLQNILKSRIIENKWKTLSIILLLEITVEVNKTSAWWLIRLNMVVYGANWFSIPIFSFALIYWRFFHLN